MWIKTLNGCSIIDTGKIGIISLYFSVGTKNWRVYAGREDEDDLLWEGESEEEGKAFIDDLYKKLMGDEGDKWRVEIDPPSAEYEAEVKEYRAGRLAGPPAYEKKLDDAPATGRTPGRPTETIAQIVGRARWWRKA